MVIWNLKFWLWRTEVAIEQPLKGTSVEPPNMVITYQLHVPWHEEQEYIWWKDGDLEGFQDIRTPPI
jgi:hypothetical protein